MEVDSPAVDDFDIFDSALNLEQEYVNTLNMLINTLDF